MIQVKIFNSTGFWKIKSGREYLNEFLQITPEENVIRIQRVHIDQFMLTYKTKAKENETISTCQCGKTHSHNHPAETVSADHPKRPEPEEKLKYE